MNKNKKLQKITNKIIQETKKYFKSTNAKKAILGLSGGIDSALTAKLLTMSLGRKKVVALIMPDSQITSKDNLKDAINFAKSLKIKYYVVDIRPILNKFENLPWKQSKTAKANLSARIRAVILYNYANSHKAIVTGTGNKTEFHLGYFTKYGDAAADFFPIISLLKKQVIELAEQLEIPQKIIEKKPTAELWKGQTDEKEIGLTYKEIDEILELVLKNKTNKLNNKKKSLKRILELIKKSKHKRTSPKFILVN
ncbi:MAG: NAD+ synthase [Candidatus Diapherotrites archaeon]